VAPKPARQIDLKPRSPPRRLLFGRINLLFPTRKFRYYF
jgi:hypothetical protein